MTPKDIEERKPVWIALSSFYLDTELDPYDFEHITQVILKSPFSFEEVKYIDRTEVFPVLYMNLMIVAGEWAGFEENWLTDEIIKKTKNQTPLKRFWLKIKYSLFKNMFSEYWSKLEAVYQKSYRS